MRQITTLNSVLTINYFIHCCEKIRLKVAITRLSKSKNIFIKIQEIKFRYRYIYEYAIPSCISG